MSFASSQQSFLINSLSSAQHPISRNSFITFKKPIIISCKNKPPDSNASRSTRKFFEDKLGKLAMVTLAAGILTLGSFDPAVAAKSGGRVGGQAFRSSRPSAPPRSSAPRTNNSRTNIYINPPVAPPLGGYGYGYGYGYGGYGWSPFSFFAPGPGVAVGIGGGFDTFALFLFLGAVTAVVHTAIRYFVRMLVELVVLYSIQHREFRDVIGNLLVLLIGGIPIAMPRVLSTTMVIGSRMLSRPEVIIKRMSAIEKMAGMGVLCCNKTWTLNLKKLTVDQDLIEVFANDFAKKHVLLFAARASRTENQDAIDAAIIGTLADPKEILTLCDCKEDLKKKVHSIIYKFACQVVPEKSKDSAGGPWQFVGLLPLIHPPRHDSAEAIRKALNIGAQLSIIKDIGQKLGVGTNMHSFAIFHSED